MTPEILSQIALAALVSGMQQCIQHYFPWGLIFRRELPRVIAYAIGTLAYIVPLTVLFIQWDKCNVTAPGIHLLALWVCVSASGAAVILVRGIDWMLDRVRRSYEDEELSDAKTGQDQ
jgi:hypothetical protein